MNIKKYLLLISFASIIIISNNTPVISQNNTTYWMQHLPQATYQNPAKQTGCKIFIDLPLIPNFDINLGHSGFTVNDAIKPKPYTVDSFMIDLDGIEKALKDNNNINFETNFSIINASITLKNDMNISFGINYKGSEYFKYPKALIEIRRGNYRENGTPLSFDFNQNFILYREIYAGVSKKINENLNVGGRLKFLTGYGNLKSSTLKIDWYTNTDDDGMYEWTFISDIDMKSASVIPWDFTYDDDGYINDIDVDTSRTDDPSLYTFPENTGFGIDLGIEYKINDRLNLSAALTDFGFIKWKTSPKIMTQKAEFIFDGVDISKYINSLDDITGDNSSLADDIEEDIIDTVLTVFNPDIEDATYTTGLNSKIYLGADFKITNNFDLGLLYKGMFVNNSLISSYTLSANTNFFKAWSFSLSYSLMNSSANNLGLGFAYKIGPFQMYIVSDNIAAPFWAANESDFSDDWIKNTKTINLSFGMHFLICGNNKDIGLME
ncbi:MAG: hypothetical protein GXO50_03510 [Chlorobi bacterium]|nr:hypothetical protein [Chlorobiota bacterium]